MGNVISLNGQIGLPSSRQMLAAAGYSFNSTNPTPGTAIAYALKTAYSATANGLFSISNPAGSGVNVQLDRLKLIQTATAATGCLNTRFEIFAESGVVALTSAALAVTPVNLKPDGNAAKATVTFFSAGAGTVAAAVGTRREIGWGSCQTGASIVYDSLTVEFGTDGPSTGTAQLTGAKATAAADYVTFGPAVTVPPGWSAWMNLWVITQALNAPSYEFSLVHNEVPV